LPAGTLGVTFLGSSIGSLFERIGAGDTKDKVLVIAKGYAPLSPNMRAGAVTVDLTVPEDVTLWKAAPPKTSIGTRPPLDQEKTLRQNDRDGTVTLSVEVFDV
jgi:hypothetical protein